MGRNIILICQYSALFQNVVQELKNLTFLSTDNISEQG